MAKIGEKELKEQIKDNKFSNIYIIYGEETYLKDLYIKKIKSKLVDPAFADFNYHEYEGKDCSIDDVLRDAQMMPMMSEYSVVLVRDFPFSDNSEAVSSLKEYAKDVCDTSVLIFWYDSLNFDIKKNSKWNTVINIVAKAGSAVNLEKRSLSDLARMIVSYAKKQNRVISLADAQYLISVVGSDLKTIFNELEKMCNFAGGEITRAIIDNLAVKSLQARVFDLSKFILRGDSDSAYNVLNTLFVQKEEPIAVLSVISSCYVDMYRVKCAKTANVNENNLTEFFSYKNREFLIKNAARDCRNISTEGLRKAIDILSHSDEMMKSTSVDKNLLLEETVAKLLMLRSKYASY